MGFWIELICDSCGVESCGGLVYSNIYSRERLVGTIRAIKMFMCERCLWNHGLFNPCKRLIYWFPSKSGTPPLEAFVPPQ